MAFVWDGDPYLALHTFADECSIAAPNHDPVKRRAKSESYKKKIDLMASERFEFRTDVMGLCTLAS